jgi:hypothetical protein
MKCIDNNQSPEEVIGSEQLIPSKAFKSFTLRLAQFRAHRERFSG